MSLFENLEKLAASDEGVPYHPLPKVQFKEKISPENVKKIFEGCYDFTSRELYIGGDRNKTVFMCFIDGIVSGDAIAETVVKPVTDPVRFGLVKGKEELIDLIVSGGAYGHTAKKREKMDDLVGDMLLGFSALVFDGQAVTFETRSSDKRSVSEPQDEKSVKGAKDTFIEILKTNSSLVRKRLLNPNLKMKQVTIGRQSRTAAVIVYIDGLTEKGLVETMEQRLSEIDTDGIIAAADIEESIVDNPRSPFPQLIRTERPDKFCMNLVEGRVGLLIDGMPVGYLAPGTFTQFLKVPGDNASHFIVASWLTVLRHLAVFVTLLLPGFFVAVSMYHHEMLPTKLLQSIISNKQAVPFSMAIEVLAMLLAFEFLQEAGLRLPNPAGDTLSIIGALIVGQSAVEAKVVSPITVIIIAVSGICGYTMPNQDMAGALRLWRFLIVLSGIAGGLLGVVLCSSLLVYHLSGIESFGVPYLTPYAGKEKRHMIRGAIRLPLKLMKLREAALKPENVRRQK